jgi:bifunctional NMN adenylyltransferase/nudix hydrolase
MKKAELAVYIGRFQPWHKGHASVLKEAHSVARNVLILLGTENGPPTLKNPWLYSARLDMIGDHPNTQKSIVYDYPSDNLVWRDRVVTRVEELGYEKNIVLIGRKKDESSFYLDLFPFWKLHLAKTFLDVNATDIRDSYFRKGKILTQYLDQPAINFLKWYKDTEQYKMIKEQIK